MKKIILTGIVNTSGRNGICFKVISPESDEELLYSVKELLYLHLKRLDIDVSIEKARSEEENDRTSE